MTIKVMIVDDDPVIRTLISEIILNTGNQVETCENGATCLSHLENEIPDLLVLDLQMPDMTGMDVLERIRNNPKIQSLPVVLLSANSDSAIVQNNAAKADHVLQKPFNVRDFISLITQFS